MDHFHFKDGQLHAEDVAISTIAEAIGTPFYCYSTATLRHHMQVFAKGLAALSPMICFAVKANPNPHVLRVLHEAGAGADVVSQGEIMLALKAGIPAKKIVFSGVGKTRDEMAYALRQGIFQFNVESAQELQQLQQVASNLQIQAPVALRINPDVNAVTHEKITTGRKDSKFGIDIAQAPEIYALAQRLSHIKVQGVSVHIGSQLTQLSPFERAFVRVRQFVEEMRQQGHAIDIIDLGGGLGIPYHSGDNSIPTPEAYGAMVVKVMQGLKARYIFEPGRLIAGNAGILVASIIYTKANDEAHRFIITDAGMNDLMRPAMYDAHHDIVPVMAKQGKQVAQQVVGPVCESSDVFRRDVELHVMQEGELLAFRSAGAYGASMSSTYNTRPLVPEVLVDGKDFRIIRKRKSYESLLADYD